MNEFDLINQLRQQQKIKRSDVILSIGDDCALVSPRANQQLAISTDTLVSGIHFFPDMPAFDLGYKALSINLSDLAAMGAEPAWATLALTLPDANATWLHDFCEGLFYLANQYQIEIIGGDTTRGPLTITLQILGFTPPSHALTRSGAQPGDHIYVTGTLGDAGLGLRLLQEKKTHPDQDYFLSRFYRPTPRIEIGIALREIASAAIDISDGLLADLSHILEKSHVSAEIQLDTIPLSSQLQKNKLSFTNVDALSSGEDYELCFTVPQKNLLQLKEIEKKINCPIHHIGHISENKHPNLIVLDKNQNPASFTKQGYDHFK